MKSFKTYLTEQELLNEKLLLINNGKKYGQVVFLAGGAGSGKGFAGSNFMNSQDYKVRDVDELKKAYMKLGELKNKFPEIKGLNLKNPKDVFKLHDFVEKKGIVDRSLEIMLGSAKNKETLPNIIFDVTLKNVKKVREIVPALQAAGYETKNVHLVWVLTDYKVAVQANRERERVVPDDILLLTHVGAHKTMWDIIGKGNVPKEINGGVYVILNNRENTVFYADRSNKDSATTNYDMAIKGSNVKNAKKAIIKDFKYLTFKEPGKAAKSDAKIRVQLYTWVVNNVPLTKDGVFADEEM